MKRAARSLLPVFQDGTNKVAREDMAMASLFGGLALANAGLGAVHGLAGVIGGTLGAPHGAICAALLPHVMKMNLAALRARDPDSLALARYGYVARLLTGDSTAQADDGVAWVAKLVSDLKIPGLGSYGLKPAHVTNVAAKSMHASSMKANPIVLTDGELAEIISSAA
jgi:alcohol dehydrogenase class IV